MTDFMTGFRAAGSGFHLIRQPGIRRYALFPIAINLLVFLLLGWFFYAQFVEWLAMTPLQAWDSWWIVRVFIAILKWLFILSLAIFAFFSFTLVSNILAAPFNNLLAERTEQFLRQTSATQEEQSVLAMLRMIPASIGSELRKLLYLAFWLLPIAILHFIPVVQIIAPVLLLLFGSWMLALEYLDYPMSNHGLRFRQIRQQLRSSRRTTLGFGTAASLLTLIPIVNLIAMPVAVAGATRLWVDHYAGLALARDDKA